MIPLELLLGFGIGLSLGLLGGGGSILTVPALVYLVGQTLQTAMTTSLAIVRMNSLVGAWMHGTQGTNELDPERPVAVICASGNRSQSAAALLGQKGFKTIYNVSGGTGAWQYSGLELERP